MNTSNLLKRLLEFEDVGIVGRLRKAINFTDEPKFPQWFCEPSNDRQNILEEQYGSSLSLNEETAKVKSIAEAIERYCSEIIENDLISGSYDSLENAIDPFKFINYDDLFLRNRKNEYIIKLRKTELRWVKGTDLKTNSEILIPAQLVYSPYDISSEPIIRTPISTGAAFATDPESSIKRGLLEIIERDSFMLTWLLKRRCPQIDLSSDQKLNELEQYFKRYLLEPYVLDITTDIKIPSMMSILIDKTGIGPAVSVGLKADLNVKEAIIGSLLEAQHVRGWIRFSYLKDGKPLITQPKQIRDLKSRGYYWYDDVSNLRDVNLVSYVLERGFDIYTVDISTHEVRQKGFYVIKTISPQFHPLSLDEDLPYNYSERLERYLKQNNIKELNKEPHPFL